MFKKIILVLIYLGISEAAKHAYTYSHIKHRKHNPVKARVQQETPINTNSRITPIPLLNQVQNNIPSQNHLPIFNDGTFNYNLLTKNSGAILPVQGNNYESYYHHYPKYEFKYGVEDHYTKDIHSQYESRDGDIVKGEYSLHQPDGRVRVVQYSSDGHDGFQAQVTYSGHANHPIYN